MLGPVRAATGWPGTTCLMTSVIRRCEPRSRPFDRLTTGIQGRMNGAASSSTRRKPDVGTPMMTKSAPQTASSRSDVADSAGSSRKPGR